MGTKSNEQHLTTKAQVCLILNCNNICLTYISKLTHHIVIRAKEHLNLGSSVKSKIKKYIIECNSCNKKNHFVVIKKCISNYDYKIYKALLIKKHQLKINKRLYENSLSFLPQLF